MVGWAQETTLDVEWSHVFAPGANIVLLETPVSETEGVTGFPEIVKAENWAINHGIGDVISKSFGATEQTFPSVGSLLNPAQRVRERAAARRDAARRERRHRRDRLPVEPRGSLHVPGHELAAERSARHRRRRHDADARRQRQPPRSRRRLERRLRRGRQRPLDGVQPAGLPGRRAEHRRPPARRAGHQHERGRRRRGRLLLLVRSDDTIDGTCCWDLVAGTSEASPEFAGIVADATQVAHHRLGNINDALYGLAALAYGQGPHGGSHGSSTGSST